MYITPQKTVICKVSGKTMRDDNLKSILSENMRNFDIDNIDKHRRVQFSLGKHSVDVQQVTILIKYRKQRRATSKSYMTHECFVVCI